MKRVIFLTITILSGCSATGSYFDFRDNMTDEIALNYYDINGLCRLKESHARMKGNWMAGGSAQWPNNQQRILTLIEANGAFSAKEIELIRSGRVRVGMSELAAYCSWGFPLKMNDTIGSWGTHRQSVMGRDIYFYFENGRLRSWQQ